MQDHPLIHSVRHHYAQITARSSAPVEWAWSITRIVVVLVTLAVTYANFPGFEGIETVPIASGFVVLYSTVFGYLLKRGFVGAVFLAGFVLDNIVVATAWLISVNELGPDRKETDLWLILIPLTIVGVARIGHWAGLFYTAAVAGFLVVVTLSFDSETSYAADQVAVRTTFLVIAGLLSAWLVASLNRQRDTTNTLLGEAESLGEIGQVMGSSLDLAANFPKASSMAGELIPFDTLALMMLTDDRRLLKVLEADCSRIFKISAGQTFELESDEIDLESAVQNGLSDDPSDWASIVPYLVSAEGVRPFAGVHSAMVVAVRSGDEVNEVLLAVSSERDGFNAHHRRTFSRIASILGAALANQQLYVKSLQLINERDARLELDATNRKLEQDHQAQEMFLSAVSHELRTPLTSIIAFNDLLLRNQGNNLTERQISQLQLVRRSGQQLAALVDDLLDLSISGSRHAKLAPVRFEAIDAIQQVLAAVDPMLKSRRQTLLWQGRDQETQITADLQRFSQVLANLLSNASKYSPQDSRIELACSVGDGTFSVSVRDYGVGISDEHMAHLFQPFFRAPEHRANKVPGTGLGLVISRNLIRAHGGDIEITSSQSDHDSGTLVRIWLPLDGSGVVKRDASEAA